MFRFAIDPQRKLIMSWIEGFLTLEEAKAWAREEQAAASTLGCRSGEFLLLVDTSRCAIQSQEVIGHFQHIIETSTHKARRVAIMQGGSLVKMQTRRIVAGNARIAHFGDLEEASAWLFEETNEQAEAIPPNRRAIPSAAGHRP